MMSDQMPTKRNAEEQEQGGCDICIHKCVCPHPKHGWESLLWSIGQNTELPMIDEKAKSHPAYNEIMILLSKHCNHFKAKFLIRI